MLFIQPGQVDSDAIYSRSILPPPSAMPSAATRFQATLPLATRNVTKAKTPSDSTIASSADLSNSDVLSSPAKLKHETSDQAENVQGQNSSQSYQNDYRFSCTCKNSQCLKLYCKCFAARSLCMDYCRCKDCKNNDLNPANETLRCHAVSIILHKNPSAFESKFTKQRKSEVRSKSADDSKHKFGCKCRKSACLKKYCECYNAGVKCR